MANSSYISELKQVIMKEIVADDLIVKAIGSPNYDAADLDESASDVEENYIYTWNQNPEVIEDVITFITLQVHITKYGSRFVHPTVEICIYSHNEHMELSSKDFPGIVANRNDYLSQLLDNKFNGRRTLGEGILAETFNPLGELTLTKNSEGLFNKSFCYRQMIFETLDVNGSFCKM